MNTLPDETIIARQARKIETYENKLANLEETIRRRNECMDKRKRDAGFTSAISFDDVWDQALKALREKKLQDKLK